MQALSSAGDLVIPSRKADPRIEWQRYKIDRNNVHVLTRLTRSGRCRPMHAISAPAIVGSCCSPTEEQLKRKLIDAASQVQLRGTSGSGRIG